MKRLCLFFALVLVAAACGGDSGDESPVSTAAGDDPTTTAASPAPGDTAAVTTSTAASDDGGADDAGSGGEGADGVSTGSATIAGETYEFSDTGFPGLQCDPDAFGVAFIAALQGEEIDGKIGSMTVAIPFPGEEETAGILPAVSLTEGDVEWVADEEDAEFRDLPAGSSQVDSYEITGNTITGTATFYDRGSSFGDELVVEQGTFEVTCVEG